MADRSKAASDCTIQDLPPEILLVILQNLSISDILWARLVNRGWFEAAMEFAPAILYDFAVGPEANPTPIQTLMRSKFPYQNFRIFVPWGGDCTLPTEAGVHVQELVSVCSKALSFQFVEGGVEAAFLHPLLRAAAENLKLLVIEECEEGNAKDLFRLASLSSGVDELMLLFPRLEYLAFVDVFVSDALLTAVLQLAPKLRALSLRWTTLTTYWRPNFLGPHPSASSIQSPSKQSLTAHVLFGLLAQFCPGIELLEIDQQLSSGNFPNFAEKLCQAAANYPTVRLKELCLSCCIPLADCSHPSVQRLWEVSPCLTNSDSPWRVKFTDDPDLCPGSGQELLLLCRKAGYPGTETGALTMLRIHQQRRIKELLGIDLGHQVLPVSFFVDLDLSHLTTLELKADYCNPAAWQGALSAISKGCWETLTALSLAENEHVTDDVLPRLCELFPRLQMLNLADCRIVTAGGIAISSGSGLDQKPPLSTLKGLVGLHLGGTPITDVALERGLKNPGLEFLSIELTDVSDIGLLALNSTAKNLVFLETAYCEDLSDAGIEQFIRNAPRLRKLGVKCPWWDDDEVAKAIALPQNPPRPQNYGKWPFPLFQGCPGAYEHL